MYEPLQKKQTKKKPYVHNSIASSSEGSLKFVPANTSTIQMLRGTYNAKDEKVAGIHPVPTGSILALLSYMDNREVEYELIPAGTAVVSRDWILSEIENCR